jgi:hypothetical protein
MIMIGISFIVVRRSKRNESELLRGGESVNEWTSE